MLFLEINDWQIRVVDESGGVLYDEPAAAAAMASNGIAFGMDAQDVSRTHPQQFSSHYFHRLNADPLPAQLDVAKNNADLIYHHLRALELRDSVIAAVPGHVTNAQLGLLLGIAREAGVEIEGFIDSALMYVLDVPLDGATAHVLDIEQHRASVTPIAIDGSRRATADGRVFDALGASGIVDGWLNVIADQFVQRTRFDPLHSAATEQQLFDLVNSWFTSPEITSQSISVMTGELSRDIEVSAEVLREKLEQRIEAVDLSGVEQLVITPRAQRIPALAEILENRVTRMVAAPDLSSEAIRRLAKELPPDRIERITAGTSDVEHVTRPAQRNTSELATHLLVDNVAKALHETEFAGHVEGPVEVGATIVIGDRRFTAIKVE